MDDSNLSILIFDGIWELSAERKLNLSVLVRGRMCWIRVQTPTDEHIESSAGMSYPCHKPKKPRQLMKSFFVFCLFF